MLSQLSLAKFCARPATSELSLVNRIGGPGDAFSGAAIGRDGWQGRVRSPGARHGLARPPLNPAHQRQVWLRAAVCVFDTLGAETGGAGAGAASGELSL
ncbi:unnamed protein product [Caretta caretta]